MPIHRWTGNESEWDVRDLKNAEEAAKLAVKCGSAFGSIGGHEFAAQLANQHPTHQQQMMVVVMAFIKEMADKPYVDLRNQASHDLAKKLMAVMEEKHFYNGKPALPFI